ncbi:MAG: sugar ABC transporter ATP-binding protein [Actinomycetota bacterium]
MENNKVVETKNLNKSFPGVRALVDFSFKLREGEVHCLIGENGAGKSTFIKILSGAYYPDSGNININSSSHPRLTPAEARSLGIQTVYQEDILVSQITAAENIFLGSQAVGRKFFVSYTQLNKKARELARSYGIELEVEKPYEQLSPSDQQFAKILKTLAQRPKVLILDEPTAVFNKEDIKLVTDLVKKIKEQGVAIIYITHHLDEVIEVADRVTVLRDGKKVATHTREDEEFNSDTLASEMVGRPVNLFYKKEKHQIGEVGFEIKGLRLAKNSPSISFKIRRGEILGLAGLKGSGRTEIVRAIFGADPKFSGKIYHNGKDITPHSPGQAVERGISLLTEDKKANGLCLNMTVAANISLVGLDKLGSFFINLKKEEQEAREFVQKLNIKTPSLSQEVQYLSGGNQQKVVLAKWLFKGVELLIVDEPTQGIDVSAKVEVYELLSGLAAEGKSIIMISSEMPELIALSGRVIVIKDGAISSELAGEDINEENILQGFMGGK